MENLEGATKFTNKCVEVFQKDLLSVLLIGSVQKEDHTSFSDIDIVLIAKKFKLKQLKALRTLVQDMRAKFDCSLLFWDEISKNPDAFVLGTHGPYQLGLILNHAKCLYGKNVLLELGHPSAEHIRRSLSEKISQYTWWARRMFIESNRERNHEMNYQLNNRLIKMMRGLLYLKEEFDIHAPTTALTIKFIDTFSVNFSEPEKKAIQELIGQGTIDHNVADMSDKYLTVRLNIVNKIHNLSFKLMNPN